MFEQPEKTLHSVSFCRKKNPKSPSDTYGLRTDVGWLFFHVFVFPSSPTSGPGIDVIMGHYNGQKKGVRIILLLTYPKRGARVELLKDDRFCHAGSSKK
jgi:hypothetical protein